MKGFALGLAMLLLPVTLGGQATRWAIRVYSAAGVEHGDLRLDRRSGTLLLESRDTTFLPLTEVQQDAGGLTFMVAALRASVVLDVSPDGTRMQGWLTGPNGARREWQGELIPPGIERWPVRPRVRVRQLLFGSGADVTIIPGSWVRALPDSARLEAEYQQLAEVAGLARVAPNERGSRLSALVLGADSSGREAARRILQRIAGHASSDTAFRRIFLTGDSLTLDVHERAHAYAAQRYRGFASSDVVRALAPDAGPGVEGGLLGQSQVLALWSRWHAEDSLTLARIDAIQQRDRAAWRALIALLEGYDQAVPWWQDAVTWLLEHPWLETPSGLRSPGQLVAQFWGVQHLPPPVISPVVRGGFTAAPMVSGHRLARRLIEPLNGSAREWLESSRREALAVWQRLTWHDTMTVGSAQQSATLLAPQVAAQRPTLGALLASADQIEIDPGIVPLYAVLAVIHEWHHLYATSRRLSGSAVGLRAVGTAVQLLEEDPWLAEGFAEWATEETLRPIRETHPALAHVDTEKRMALWGGMSDDPHALGYRLVRAVAARLPAATRRATIVDRLHDPTALARLGGFLASPRTAPLLLRRPMTMAVIPEVTFTWDAGVADSPTRRLLLPLFPPER